MKRYLLIFLVLALIPLASAKVVHNEWHYSDDEFTIQGVDHSVLHEYGEDKVFITAGSSSFIITPGKCAEAHQWEYCIEEIDDDINGDKVKYKDGDALAAIKIKIEEIKPEVSMERTLSSTNPSMEETVTVTVTLENNGNRPVDSFVYKDYYPEGFTILETSNKDNTYVRTGNLGVDQKLTFQYSIRAEEFMDFVSQGNLTYTYNDIDAFLKTSSKKISVERPYRVDFNIDEDKLSVGQEAVIEFSIESLEDDLEADLDLDLDGLELVSKSGNLTEFEGVHSWSGEMNSGDKEEFKVRVTPEVGGTYNVKLTGDFELDEEDYSFSEELKVTSELTGLRPTFQVAPAEVNSESSVRVRGYLQNSDSIQMEAKDMVVKVFDEEFTIPNEFVQQGKTELIFEKHVDAPVVEERTRYEASFSGKYATSRQEFPFSQSAFIRVLPKPEVISIDIETPDSVIETEAFQVVTTVSNRGGFPLQVLVQSSYRNKTTNRTLEVPAGGEESFTRSAVGEVGEKEMIFEATATVESMNVTAKASSIVGVNKTGVIDQKEKQIFTEETGFFTELVTNIGNFLTWIFKG